MKASKWISGLVSLLVVGGASAQQVTLHQVTYPEREQVKVGFTGTGRAPAAELEAEVRFREGQASNELAFDDMKPAVLFGGDVTSYVLWAVRRDGRTENLGELWVRQRLQVPALGELASGRPPADGARFPQGRGEGTKRPSGVWSFGQARSWGTAGWPQSGQRKR